MSLILNMPILDSITLRNFKQVLRNSHKIRNDSIIVGCYRQAGEVIPTEQEKEIVLEAERISERMGIQLFDFLILGEQEEYFSFWDARLLENSRDDSKSYLN